MKRPLLGPGTAIDVDRLIETRLLVQANSGGGKSYLLRKLCEIVYGKVQIIVLDVEGEFHSLREQFDFVLAGQKGGDCPADCKSAALLARRLLELGTSAIIDIYELGAQRARFVRLFLESLMSAPRDLWHPVLVIVDEAHMFCPEQDKAESAGAVIDLMTRGRKRGFCGVLATQRISKLSKDAAAECNNVLIGRCNLDIDVKRAAATLGMTSKEDALGLRQLPPGSFFAFGPAFYGALASSAIAGVVPIKIGAVMTAHPKAGQRAIPVAPPRAAVQKILGKLADLPAEAEEETRTIGELRARVRELERAAKAVPVAKPATKEVVNIIPQRSLDKIEKLADKLTAMYHQFASSSGALGGNLANEIQSLKSTIAQVGKGLETLYVGESKPIKQRVIPPERVSAFDKALEQDNREFRAGADDIDGPMRKLLGALMWFASIGIHEPVASAVAFIAGYRGQNGSFNNARGRLRSAELVVYKTPGTLSLTGKGISAAPPVDTPADGAGLRRAVLARLDGPEQRLLNPLIEAYPAPMTADDLAVAAGYGGQNGSFNNARGRLRTLGLVDYPSPGMVRAENILFP